MLPYNIFYILVVSKLDLNDLFNKNSILHYLKKEHSNIHL